MKGKQVPKRITKEISLKQKGDNKRRNLTILERKKKQ